MSKYSIILSYQMSNILELDNNYASLDKIPFKNQYAVDIKKNIKIYANRNIDRCSSVMQLNTYIKNLHISKYIEAGVYEYVIIYIDNNQININLIRSVYVDKLENIISNFDPSAQSYNKVLVKQLQNPSYDWQNLAFLEPYELNPVNWEFLIKKNELREYKKNNVAASDLYECYKCNNKRCRVIQLQTRSADEPMTTFVTCLVCYNEFKC